MKPYPVKFIPIAQERIWGGHQLKGMFQYNGEKPIGEYWVLSGHPNGTSIVMNGKLAGKTLVELTAWYPEAFLGNSPQDRFPLLIKFLEANEHLSVQVHPDDDYARDREGDFGKTEAWYILDHHPEAKIVYGHSFASKDEYKQAIEQKRIREYLHYREIEKDQLIYVPARTLHTLLAGTIVIEIQQTSDVTYRVYDWDRAVAEGTYRELHIDKAADVMAYGKDGLAQGISDERRILRQHEHCTHERLISCPHFVIEKISIEKGSLAVALGKQGNPDIVIVARGIGHLLTEEGTEPLPIKAGDTILVPGTIYGYQIKTTRGIQLLRSYY